MPDRSGQTIGNYHLSERLGESAFAETYQGEDTRDQEQVALKLLTPRNVAADMPKITRVAALGHPLLCPLRESGTHAGQAFYVMPYYAKSSLRKAHPEGAKVALAMVQNHVWQLADPLGYLHQMGIVHLNLKPENLLIDPHNRLIISDPALGPRITSYGVPPDKAGAWARYMAPEQFFSQAVTSPASDQYSLAVMIYEWLCGVRPFPERDFMVLSGKHREVAPPPLRKHEPGIPPAVEQAVLKALSKRPLERYPSVQLFAQALLPPALPVVSGYIGVPQVQPRGSGQFPVAPPQPPVQQPGMPSQPRTAMPGQAVPPGVTPTDAPTVAPPPGWAWTPNAAAPTVAPPAPQPFGPPPGSPSGAIPVRMALDYPQPTLVRPPADPARFIKDFLDHPNADPGTLYTLAAAIGSVPGDASLQGKLGKALGKVLINEGDLEDGLVNLAPALNMPIITLLQECAAAAAKEWALEQRTIHLLAYVRLALKYALLAGPLPELADPGVTRVLAALGLAAPLRDAAKPLLQIIRGAFTRWPEDELRTLWAWYERKYFP